MAISNATLKMVRFSPELLPDAWYGNVPLIGEVTPPVLDLRSVPPYLAKLEKIQLVANANVELRAIYDASPLNFNTAAMLSAFPGAWELPAIKQLRLNFYGIAAVANYAAFYSLWGIKPTVADKIFWGLPLTDAEKTNSDNLNIADSVDKGMLPLPVRHIIDREYPVLGEETHTQNPNINAANTPFLLESIYPRNKEEILVLTRIAANPGTAAQNIQLVIDRDNDQNYLQFPVFPLSLVPGGEIECFVPAITELRISATAAVAPGNNLFRYTFRRIALNNILRVRFGLITQNELAAIIGAKKAADLVARVLGGVV